MHIAVIATIVCIVAMDCEAHDPVCLIVFALYAASCWKSVTSRGKFCLMIVSGIHLENFRNYEEVNLSPVPGLNILYGNNGQGKTNVIEAVNMCACARSHRTSKDVELIRHGSSFYNIDLKYYASYAEVLDDAYEESVGIRYKRLVTVGNEFKRELTKDGISVPRVVDFVGTFHAVIFAPEDLSLVKDGPAVRRRFLDLLLSQIKPSYFQNLQLFSRILKQRNTLLKQFRDLGKSLDLFQAEQLSMWDEEFARVAANLIMDRLQLIDKLSFWAGDIHKKISGGLEKLRLVYRTLSGVTIDLQQADIVDNVFQRLKKTRNEDIFRGSTSSGPHRDDFDLLINDFTLKSFGSQGQQRTAVLALKMAELEIIRHQVNEAPVLLLDDVLSELDIGRREHLLNSLQHVQIFVTCTDPEQLDQNWLLNVSADKPAYFKVQHGTIARVS